MHRPINKDVLVDFAAEVNSLVPAVAQSVAAAAAPDPAPDHLPEVYRLLHTIKGAAAMVGLSALSHLAAEVEALADAAMAAGPSLTGREATLINEATAGFAAYVDAAAADAETSDILACLSALWRRFKGEPSDGDAAAVRALLEASGELAARPAPVADQLTAAATAAEFEIDVRPQAVASSDLAEVFHEEASEHLRIISTVVGQLRAAPEDREALQELRRSVHTLKGAAGMVGFTAVGQLAHRMEDLLDRLYEESTALSPAVQDAVSGAADAFDDLINGTGDDDALRSRVRALYGRFDHLLNRDAGVGPDVLAVPAVAEARETEPPQPALAVEAGQPTGRQAAPVRSRRDRRSGLGRRSGEQVVRVPFERLDDVLKLVSELVINRSTFEQHFGGLMRQVDELGLSTERLRRVAAKLDSEYEVRALAGQATGKSRGESGQRVTAFTTHGFDELEMDRYTEFHLLSRELTETASDINTVGARLRDTITDFDSDLTRLGRLTGEVQDKVMQFRMLPLATLASRLERTVRVTASERGRLASLVLEGEHVALDKAVLEEMSDPLLHLLRNAVDHGLESPDARRLAGKPEQGRVVVRAFHEGTQVVIQIEDDGAGLDVERIRATAVARGVVTAEAAAGLADEEVFDFIFAPGFSTASAVTQISGRGVGMDIVRSRVERLKGHLTVNSTPGVGARFTVRLPMTLAITRILLIRAGNQTFAVPMAAVLQIVKMGASALGRVGFKQVVNVDGRTYPLVVLTEALGIHTSADTEVGDRPILLVSLGDRQIAVSVDEIVESRDAVVKSMGAHLRRVHGFSGATLLGDGSVVLIVNPDDLAHDAERVRSPRQMLTPASDREPYTVMVVDDSLSVRHVLTGLIKKSGWNVVQARDGVEALELLHRAPRRPDVMLLDIEMPRMDGYELTSTLRAQPAHRDIPIVMITSRAGDKHRQKAFAMGVTDYMVKPFQDDVLVARIETLAQASRSKGAAA